MGQRGTTGKGVLREIARWQCWNGEKCCNKKGNSKIEC